MFIDLPCYITHLYIQPIEETSLQSHIEPNTDLNYWKANCSSAVTFQVQYIQQIVQSFHIKHFVTLKFHSLKLVTLELLFLHAVDVLFP